MPESRLTNRSVRRRFAGIGTAKGKRRPTGRGPHPAHLPPVRSCAFAPTAAPRALAFGNAPVGF